MFKENAKKNSFFREINCISQALNFVEENDEEVFCTRYNKCLTLVPHSRRKFSEVFQQWQPQVIMEKIEDLPEKILSEPPIKKQKHEEKPEIYPVTFTVNEVLDVADRISIVQEETEESNEGMSEKEWVRSEIENSELIETDTGSEWLCKYCEPGPISFTNLQDFRNHLLSTHLSYEQFSMIEVSPDDEEIIEEDYEVDNVEQSDYDDKSVISLKETEMKETEPKSRTRPSFSKIIKSPRFEKLVCIDCDYQFTSQAHFQAHLNGHHLYEIVSKYSNFPICSICNTMFCDENFESLHQQRHDNSELVNEPMPAEGCFLKLGHRRSQNVTETSNEFEIMGIISCGHCLKKFNDEESCRLHQLIFHVTVLKCPIENRLFKGNQAFTIHLKNNHPELFGDEVKFLCSVCKAEFETLFDKLRHMKICDMKKYACNHCDKKFSHKCYLTSHMRQVSGQSSVVCEICEKVCRDKGDYEIHKR